MSLIIKEGSAAIRCDCLTCHAEILARTSEQAIEQARIEGWNEADSAHLCPDCVAGNCPGEVAAIGRFGLSRVRFQTPKAVTKGEEVLDLSGKAVGHFVSDAKVGEFAEIDFIVAPPDKLVIPGARSCLASRSMHAAPSISFPANSWGTGAGELGGAN